MAKLNPDYLVKDELEFGVKLRGEVPAVGVLDLRKQMCSLVRRGEALVGTFEDKQYAERDLSKLS